MKELIAEENKQSARLSEYNNSWYKPGPGWKTALWMLVNALFFNNQLALLNSLKSPLLRLFGAKVGKRVLIKPSVNIKYPWFLQIGDDVWIGENAWIDNLTTIRIGNNVCISQGAFLLTGNHDYSSVTFDLRISPIVLEEGVWLGAKSIVCPGVTCGSHAVLSVASVAVKDLEAYSVYFGLPAVKMKDRKIK